ncbi:MAG TPA: ATP-binding protein, partial [Phycisphaerae bacterium]
MDHISVEVAQDHIESLTRVRQPIAALEELIWNALDADATNIEVRLTQNQLFGLERIVVTDNGHGIHRDNWKTAFGKLGGSPKLNMTETSGGRKIHGKAGRGRFKAFGLGKKVTWRSRFCVGGTCRQFEIIGNIQAIRDFAASEAISLTNGTSGVSVEIADIEKNFSSLLNN